MAALPDGGLDLGEVGAKKEVVLSLLGQGCGGKHPALAVVALLIVLQQLFGWGVFWLNVEGEAQVGFPVVVFWVEGELGIEG